MSESATVELTRQNDTNKPEAIARDASQPTKLRGGLAVTNSSKARDQKSAPDEFEIRRKAFFGL